VFAKKLVTPPATASDGIVNRTPPVSNVLLMTVKAPVGDPGAGSK
jgi:hypothetical protein